MKLTVKISKLIGFCFCCALGLTFCTDDSLDDPPDDPSTETTESRVLEAFPGIQGEIMDFLINGDTITVEKIDDKYVFQGDIFLTEEQLTSGAKKGAGINSFIKKWHCNTVYYKISSSIQHMSSTINEAIEHYEANTNLKFKERTVEENYVEFVLDSGNASYEGMRGGRQKIWIANYESSGTVIHEIGHAIGLIHEHSREDRDGYVFIFEDNIKEGEAYNFDKVKTDYKTGAFDWNSIMLYDSYAFSIANDLSRPTIVKVTGLPYDIQEDWLSGGDIGIINKIYPEIPEVCALDSIMDIDGNYYPIIEIGTQVWMAENLKTTTYNDGSPIPLITNGNEWTNLAQDAYCWFLNDEASYKDQGAIYKWYTLNTGKLCPVGWHVPSNSDWITLIDYLGGYDVAGGLLKETGTLHWRSPNVDATDEFCFKALPNGGRSYDGNIFYENERSGAWWSLSSADTDNAETNLHMAYLGMIYNDSPGVSVNLHYKVAGYCVRCLQD